jgi:hypothetical protein
MSVRSSLLQPALSAHLALDDSALLHVLKKSAGKHRWHPRGLICSPTSVLSDEGRACCHRSGGAAHRGGYHSGLDLMGFDS